MSIISHAYRVLDELDLQVLTDVKDEEFTPCYYAGWRDEPDAGIYGQCASPCFNTQEELIDWINANEKELRDKFSLSNK